MSFELRNKSDWRTTYPLATEFALVVAAAVGFYLVPRTVATASSRVVDAVPLPGGLLAEGLVHSSVLLAVLGLLVGGYAAWRGIEIGLTLPTRDDLPAVGAALALPAALVGLTALVGEFTGTPYGSLTPSTFAPDASIEPFLVVTGLGLFVGVPCYLLLCQVVVQGSFERVVGGAPAVALTTATAGFLLTGSPGGGLSPFPERGKLVGAVLFGLAVGVALYATERADRRWVLYLSYLPAGLFVAATLVSAVAAVETVAGVLFAGTQLAVLGLAAVTYRRTGSLAVPALAYLSLSLTHSAVVFAVETGASSW